MAIDRKYGRVTFERPNSIGEDEPVVVFRAQDKLLPVLLEYYLDECQDAGSPPHHLTGIHEARHQIIAWQRNHFTQVPKSAPVGESSDG